MDFHRTVGFGAVCRTAVCCATAAATTKEAQHSFHHGRRHRLDAGRRLPPRHRAWGNTQHRPTRARRWNVHDVLCHAELHVRSQRFYHRDVSAEDGHDPASTSGKPIVFETGYPHNCQVMHDLGYNTAQFGKNHLGDHTEALPTAHGFQEYWGYLYHLDAMQQVSFPDINKTPT